MKNIIISAAFLFILNACDSKKEPLQNEEIKGPKNVILMIGDGMGISQISAGMISNDWKLNLERCTDIGLIKTYSANNLITESAAGATAFACGQKTYNGAIGVGKDTSDLTNIFELADEMGFNTGLVATSSIVHATPASFYSHEDSRHKYDNIALDLIKSNIDAFAGGGTKFFTEREDGRNLINEMKDSEFIWVNSLDSLAISSKKRVGYLGAQDGMPKMLEGRGDFLQKSSMAIINRLNTKNTPFMVMIEGSQIDWGGHANDGEYIRTEMMDFDACVGSVLDFAEKDGETLVIITADHETGGFSITGGQSDSLSYAFTSLQHTPVLIPVFAYGPESEDFSGVYENTDIFHKIKSLLNL
jgi:alkaline phosphatase